MSLAAPETLSAAVTLYCGDCLAVLESLAANSVDAVVTDPPYHLASIVRRFGADGAAPAKDYSGEKPGATGAYARASTGFMGKQWDGGDVAFKAETWAKILRVLKPGGHLVAFAAPKLVHRMAVAIEDAGFEIRDRIVNLIAADSVVGRFLETLSAEQSEAFFLALEESRFGGELFWAFGTGFPKSLDISKAIDKAKGLEREIIRERYVAKRIKPGATVVREGGYGKQDVSFIAADTAPASEESALWQGWGTALKPAYEPIVLARKPLGEETVAANVLKWGGTGGINIDATRIAIDPSVDDPRLGGAGDWSTAKMAQNDYGKFAGERVGSSSLGRWPANLCHDGSDEVVAAFPDSEGGNFPSARGGGGIATSGHKGQADLESRQFVGGTAARFFFSAKADQDDRLGSKHPTVKPIDLMRWLVRMVCPKGGTVLDPFAGTGSTGEAAAIEGCKAVLIEREEEYQADIRRRVALMGASRAERKREAIKTRGLAGDAGPLFGGVADAPIGGGGRFTESSPTRMDDGTDDLADRAKMVTT